MKQIFSPLCFLISYLILTISFIILYIRVQRDIDQVDAAYILSYATLFLDFACHNLLNDTMKELLSNASGQKTNVTASNVENISDEVHLEQSSLPQFYKEAIQCSCQAQVITSKIWPFEICHVNSA